MVKNQRFMCYTRALTSCACVHVCMYMCGHAQIGFLTFDLLQGDPNNHQGPQTPWFGQATSPAKPLKLPNTDVAERCRFRHQGSEGPRRYSKAQGNAVPMIRSPHRASDDLRKLYRSPA